MRGLRGFFKERQFGFCPIILCHGPVQQHPVARALRFGGQQVRQRRCEQRFISLQRRLIGVFRHLRLLCNPVARAFGDFVSLHVPLGKLCLRATSFSNPDGSGSGVLELLGDVVAPGTLSTNALTVGLGQNLLSNTDFSDGMNGWETYKTGGGGNVNFHRRGAGASWAGKYYPTLGCHLSDVSACGSK